MKKSISHLPKARQADLHFLTGKIKERLPQTEIIILYGSYATGKYVEYDERVEFGVPTSYMSDYDILVITSGIAMTQASHSLDNIDNLYYKDPETQTPVQFINEDIKEFNKQLEEGRYFYTELKKEGIVLYNSGNYKLARRRKLKFEEIQEQAKEYFIDRFSTANGFLRQANHAYNDMDYRMASFDLHQACENYCHTIRLSFMLNSRKQHNLSKLFASVKRFSEELPLIFPYNTDEEKRLFKILKNAYIEARYNPDFIVTKEDIEALIPKVKRLRDVTKRICEQKIEEHGQME